MRFAPHDIVKLTRALDKPDMFGDEPFRLPKDAQGTVVLPGIQVEDKIMYGVEFPDTEDNSPSLSSVIAKVQEDDLELVAQFR